MENNKSQSKSAKERLIKELAPKGYHAELANLEGSTCVGCAFEDESICGEDRPCSPSERKDRCNVIFIENET